MTNYSGAIAEGNIEDLKKSAEFIIEKAAVKIVKDPAGGMIMARHKDGIENLPFNLGELYTTECEAEVDSLLGYSCVMGHSSERALYGAIIDAVLGNNHPLKAAVEEKLKSIEADLQEKWKREKYSTQKTKVDFDVY